MNNDTKQKIQSAIKNGIIFKAKPNSDQTTMRLGTYTIRGFDGQELVKSEPAVVGTNDYHIICTPKIAYRLYMYTPENGRFGLANIDDKEVYNMLKAEYSTFSNTMKRAKARLNLLNTNIKNR